MLHPKNRHQGRYDLKELIKSTPELEKYVITNSYNDQTVDFFDPAAVRMLNKAILKLYYDVNFWEIPAGYLCPPIPGRADYIHHIADLLADFNSGVVPEGNSIKC
ncbi:MAG: RlmF-related methyltransferase, partial [Bacteroidales bacterium]